MRVISLFPGATDAIIALGGADLLVGASHACDLDQSLAVIPRVTAPAVDATDQSGAIDAAIRKMAAAGRPLFALDEARIVSLAPDLIITQALCNVCAVGETDVRTLAGRMVPVPRVVSISGTTLEAVFGDIATIGAAIGFASESDELLLGLRRRMRTVHDTLKAAHAPRPRVAVIEWADPMYAGGHWVPEQVARAGGIDVLATAGTHSAVVTAEQVRDAAADVVLVAPCGFDVGRATEEAAHLISAHPWLGAAHVWAIDADSLTSRPGPHLVDGIEVMARIFAPLLFSPDDSALARRIGG